MDIIIYYVCGVSIFFCITLLFIICGLCCKLMKKNKDNTEEIELRDKIQDVRQERTYNIVSPLAKYRDRLTKKKKNISYYDKDVLYVDKVELQPSPKDLNSRNHLKCKKLSYFENDVLYVDNVEINEWKKSKLNKTLPEPNEDTQTEEK